VSAHLKKPILLLLLIALYFAVRVPLASSPLYGEEGIFADQFANRPAGPDYLLMGRVDGAKIYAPPRHPAPIYKTIEVAGSLGSGFLPANLENDSSVTPPLRLMFSIFQLVIWIGLCAYLLYGKSAPENRVLLGIIAGVIVAPIAVVTSLQLQVDGSVGVIMNGLLALVLMVRARNDHPGRWFLPALFLSTVFLSTGKQEWTIVLSIAVVMWAGYLVLARLKWQESVSAEFGMIAIILLGMFLGHLHSFSVDPENYLGGMGIIVRMTHTQTVASDAAGADWLKRTSRRLPMLLTPIALIVAIGTLAVFQLKRIKPTHVFLALFGFGLFGAFFVSNWETDPRYFAPSLAVLTMSVVSLFPDYLPKRLGFVMVGIAIFMFGHTAKDFYNGRKMVCEPNWLAHGTQQQPGSLLILSTAQGWNKPGVDFAGSSLGFEGAQDFASQYVKNVHKPVLGEPKPEPIQQAGLPQSKQDAAKR